MKKIIFIGYRGTGKTTIGKMIAEQIDFEFIDTDEEIVKKTGKSIPEIFAEKGEEGFRKIEKDVVKEVLKKEFSVISAGGGAILDEENRKMMKQNGIVILLTADVNTIYNRIKDDENRPSLSNLPQIEEIAELLQYREPFYKETAHITISTEDIDLDNIVESILKKIGEQLKDTFEDTINMIVDKLEKIINKE